MKPVMSKVPNPSRTRRKSWVLDLKSLEEFAKEQKRLEEIRSKSK